MNGIFSGQLRSVDDYINHNINSGLGGLFQFTLKYKGFAIQTPYHYIINEAPDTLFGVSSMVYSKWQGGRVMTPKVTGSWSV